MPLSPLETCDDIEAAVAGETEATEEAATELNRRSEGEGDGNAEKAD